MNLEAIKNEKRFNESLYQEQLEREAHVVIARVGLGLFIILLLVIAAIAI